MGSEFLTEIPTTQNKTRTEVFEEMCPFYLAIGMSSAEYWEGDPSLARYYRKAYKIKQEEINNNAWLQGVYVYDAISTALHNALKGKNTQARSYAKQPYDFNNREKTEFEKAKEMYEEIMEHKKKPSFPECWFNYGNVLIEFSEYEKAKECLDLLLRFCTGTNLFTYHNDWRNMGILCLVHGY